MSETSSRRDIRRAFVVASPFFVLVVGHATARVASGPLGEGAWLPLALVYWTALGVIVFWGTKHTSGSPRTPDFPQTVGSSQTSVGSPQTPSPGFTSEPADCTRTWDSAPVPRKLSAWFRPSRGPRLWTVLALAAGLIPLPILLLNLHLLTDPVLVAAWLLFAFINPWFEEAYWRGLLLDATRSWPKWAAVAYSTVLFAASHPIMWGVFSIANRDWMTSVSLLVMGTVWSVAYLRTETLRWTVLSHFLVDIGNLSVFVFLNVYIPPHL